MSRVGKKPVPIPEGVNVTYKGGVLTVKGPKGTLSFAPHPDMIVKVEGKEIKVERPSDKKLHRALHGTTRQLIANMVKGVTEGYAKELEIVGTGYRGKIDGKFLTLQLGYSHPIKFLIPPDVKVEMDGPNKIRVSGIDKQRVGEVAAQIRRLKPPEPYKGKGIRYVGEYVRRKAGKAGIKE
jgi:large subunit ribosomal protein L6